jgi:DNA-binding MarR family transcriptional regulator
MDVKKLPARGRSVGVEDQGRGRRFMYQPELMQIAESLAGLIPRLARGMAPPVGAGVRRKELVDDLPLAQLRLCGALSEGPRTMSGLSRELGVSLSSLTQIADRLERARLVKRTAAEDDRRVRCLQLTARGAAMMRKRRDARLRHSLAVLEHLSATERELVRAAMETLVTACARARGDGEDTDIAASNGNGLVKSNGNGHSVNGGSKSPNHRRITNHTLRSSRKAKSRAAI